MHSRQNAASGGDGTYSIARGVVRPENYPLTVLGI